MEYCATVKISDLNSDCLENCLQHLDIVDLLNVADCNEQLRYAARYVIGRMIKGLTVKVNVWPRNWIMTLQKRFLDKTNLKMGQDLKFCLQFLRCCGDLVYGMKITYGQLDSVKCDEFLGYVNDYCSEFLIKMNVSDWGYEEGSLIRLTKPFKKVEQLKMKDWFPNGIKLSELFPNLRRIKMTYQRRFMEPFRVDIFSDHYPLLEHLSLFLFDWEEHYKNVSILLLSNPQLKSFRSNIGLQIMFDGKKKIQHANELLQNLEILDLDEIYYKTIDERIHLENLKELSLHIHIPFTEEMWTIPFICDKLESLKITVYDQRGANILRRITNYPNNVKKFSFCSYYNNHTEISKIFPSLEEIDLFGYKIYFTVDEVVRFVHEFRSLKLLLFRSLPEISIDELMTHFGNAWSVSFKSHFMSYIVSTEKKFLSIRLERDDN